MDMLVYYRSTDKSLKSFNVVDVESIEQGQQLVLEALCEAQEMFLNPLLGIIQGGKP